MRAIARTAAHTHTLSNGRHIQRRLYAALLHAQTSALKVLCERAVQLRCASRSQSKHHPARRTRARLRGRRCTRRWSPPSMSTTSNFTFVRSSSDINFEQIESLQLHVVGASSAALADLRGRQAQHVSERGLMSRAGQARRAWVPGRDCAAQRILSVHGALGEHLNGGGANAD